MPQKYTNHEILRWILDDGTFADEEEVRGEISDMSRGDETDGDR